MKIMHIFNIYLYPMHFYNFMLHIIQVHVSNKYKIQKHISLTILKKSNYHILDFEQGPFYFFATFCAFGI